MKAHVTFDTLAYAKRLKAAGVDSKIAEAQAEANVEMISNLFENTLATKQDIASLRQEIALLRQDLNHVESSLSAKFESQIKDLRIDFESQNKELRIDLENQIKELRTDLENQIKELRTDLENQIKELRTDLERQLLETKLDLMKSMKELEMRLTIRLGAIVLGGIGLFTAVFSLLHLVH